ncbi:hypothetical protein PVA17_20285 [Lysinibacillus sp. CNPSo 3705]|uniref:hypothetical protein n=1 Tax=Lysinibacillus sp. CNPSo 3705 TaxID=3028148 RepID=UPI002363BA70|nr:hypothetical protein [Lysinibacillus sp. CNPSo 3705]MDD1505084.1 hypothetical protein [Lysinibacillus sp. CNPSo 3705]
MNSVLKKLFTVNKEETIEEKLNLLDFKKELYIKDIKKRKQQHKSLLNYRYYQQEDYDKVIQFATLITEKLQKVYGVNGEFTPFELKLLNKILSENFGVSFYLLSDINDEEDQKEPLIKALVEEGFQFVDNVGYVNLDRVVSKVSIK